MDKQYGIIDQNVITDEMDFHVEEFRNSGYTVIENVLNETELAELRAELDRIYAQQEAAFTKEKLSAINETFLARALLGYSESYLKLASRPDMLKYIEKALGQYFILGLQNGIINMPNEEHHQSSWHRDLPYQNWTSSESMACNLFYCLDPFNEETGATFLLPYSNKASHIPSKEFVEKNKIQIKANPGSVVFFDSMLFHKAGYNKSNIIRRGVNVMYTRPFIKQQIDLPALLNGKYADNPFLKMLLGYDTQPAISVDDYRKKRFEKNQQ